MEPVVVYSYNDYKDFIRARIDHSDARWGLISKLSDAAGCQRSYFSRVLNSEVHLIPDHLFGLSEYWGLSEKETEYFLALLERERAVTAQYRKRWETRLRKLKQEYEDLENRVDRPIATEGLEAALFYSAWYYSALNILVSIPQYQTVDAICSRLQLDRSMVKQALAFLSQMDLVIQEGGRWKFKSGDVHVPKGSPFLSQYHAHWRDRAVLSSQRPNQEAVHFTVVQSIDASAWEKIKHKILECIEDVSQIAHPAKEEKLVSICMDFFEV